MVGQLVAFVVFVYVAACAALFFWQRALIYFPQPRSDSKLAPTMSLTTDAGSVLVTTREIVGADALIYFGGNAEDVLYNLPGLAKEFPGHAIYLLHYRGYGGSAGKPSEAAIISDALMLFDKVQSAHQDIVVVGRSLGSGVAVRVASMRPVRRLVLVTPYDSIQELAARQFSYFPVRWLLQDKFESWRYAPQVTAPTLLLAAEHDEVIPRASTEALLSRFGAGVASLKIVAGAGHNTISDDASYLPLLRVAR